MARNNGQQIVGVIPARWASTRLPGKPLAKILGRPLIQWVIAQARKSEMLARILVATDDERIRAAAEEVGAEVAMTRPDHPSGTDRVAEAVGSTAADVVINIQGDEPLMDPELIDSVAASLVSGGRNWDMATAAARIEDSADAANPNVVKVVFSDAGRALYFSRAAIPHNRDCDDVARYECWRHIGIYGYRRPFLDKLVAAEPCALERIEKLEQLRALNIGCRMMVVKTDHCGIGVDTREDIEKVEQILNKSARL